MDIKLKKEDDGFRIFEIKNVKLNAEIHNLEVKFSLKEKKIVYIMVKNDIPLYEDDFGNIDLLLLDEIKSKINDFLD